MQGLTKRKLRIIFYRLKHLSLFISFTHQPFFMKKILIKINVSLSIALLMALASCTGNETSPAKSDSLNAAKKPGITDTLVQAALWNVTLDTLWMKASDFPAKRSQLAFRFFYTGKSFTLHGWLGNPNTYNDRPADIKLEIGRPDPTIFAGSFYFGNLIFKPKEVDDIQDAIIQHKATYVLFAPSVPAAGADLAQVVYNIFITQNDPKATVTALAAIYPTGVTTNPSPPRNGD